MKQDHKRLLNTKEWTITVACTYVSRELKLAPFVAKRIAQNYVFTGRDYVIMHLCAVNPKVLVPRTPNRHANAMWK